MLIDKKFRAPRIWSNRELEKFAPFFTGRVANVSGWQDMDKEGKEYKDYFTSVSEYTITNYKAEARGFQGNQQNEIFLDLEQELPSTLLGHFDAVFNHTVLEHIFNIDKAFTNLCALSNDIVIIVVPFLQEQHADYGDYWRFTPQAVKKLFQKNGLESIYINYNDSSSESIYIFAIGSKNPEKWSSIVSHPDNKTMAIESYMLGTSVIKNSIWHRLMTLYHGIIRRLK